MDRRKQRASPHYLQGLNFLVAKSLDPAIEEFGRAASLDDRALDVPIILGNLYREKGQVGRAIQVHQQLLQRPRLSGASTPRSCSAWGSTSSAPGSWTRHRAFARCSASTRTTPRAREPREDARGPAAVGGAFRVRERLAARAPAEQRARAPIDPGVPAERDGPAGHARQRPAGGPGRLRVGNRAGPVGRAGAPEPRRSAGRLGRPRGCRGDLGARVQVAPERAYLAFDRLRAVYGHSAHPSASRNSAAASSAPRRTTGARASRWRVTSTPATARSRRWTRSSRR